MKLFLSLFLVSMVSIISFSCRKDKAPNSMILPLDCKDTISYMTQIEPIIQQNCATSGCHNVETSTAGYDFSTYASVSNNSEIILKAMKHDPQVEAMPFGSAKLDDALIQQFECWVNQGKLNN